MSLRLKWHPQFQFAGYYMAQAKGYFDEENLSVIIRAGGPGIRPVQEVESGRTDFGVGGADLLIHRSQGKPLVSLAAIFQHSALALMVHADSDIRSPSDLIEHSVAVSRGTSDEAEIIAVLQGEGVDLRRIRFVDLTSSLEPFLKRKVDAYQVYITNEPEWMRKAGVQVRLLRAIDYGVDFYGDILFTTEDMIRERPQTVLRFRRACLKGWKYAFDHPQEAIHYILRQTSTPYTTDEKHLAYEAAETRDLISANTVEIGHQNPERWERIQQILKRQGVIERTVDINRFLWQDPRVAASRKLTRRLEAAMMALAGLVLALIAYAFWNRQLQHAIQRKSAQLEAAQQDLETRSKTLHALLGLGYTLSGADRVDGLMEQVIEYIRRGTGFDRVGLYLVNRHTQQLYGVLGVDTDGTLKDCSDIQFSMLDPAYPIIAVARGDTEYFLTEDADAAFGTAYGIRHNGFVPLKAGGQIIGVITVDNKMSGRPFGEAEIRHLRGFADEIALALYNARLLDEAERRETDMERSNRELHALLGFSRLAVSARTANELVSHIVKTIRQDFGYDRVGVFLVEGEMLRGVRGTDEQGQDEEIGSQCFPLNDPSSQTPWPSLVNSERDYFLTLDAFQEYGYQTPGGKPVRHHLMLPLRTHHRIIGLIAIDNVITNRPITEGDAQPLVAFARQAASTLDNVRLMDALRNSEERLRTIVGSLSETIYSARLEGRRLIPVYISPQIEQLTGYSPDEAITLGRDFWKRIIHADDRARVNEAYERFLNGERASVEYRIQHRDGTVRWVYDTPVILKNEHGEACYVNGAVLDITARRNLEESVRQAQKMESVGTLAGGIAHDFNNLLTIINGNIELAQMDVPEDTSAFYSLAQTRRAVERAANLTQQLLTFSRKTQTHRHVYSLNAIIEETVMLLRSSLGKRIELKVQPDPELDQICVDLGQIQQVLINLCMNARDAMPDGGQITIRTQNAKVREDDSHHPVNVRPGDYVRLQVRDTGEGMDAATRERVFEPFYTTKPVGQGTGLGLAVAYAIVQDHGGWMEVQSAPGAGTVFSAYLPAEGAERVVHPPLPSARTITILVVDSDESARESLAGLLERNGHTVLTAGNGSEALAVYWTEADRVRIVICAEPLPDIATSQLIRHLRDYNADVPVILCQLNTHTTGRTSAEDVAGIIHKPFRDQEVLPLVSAVLDNGGRGMDIPR